MTRGFGASKFILGSIVELNENLQITASKYDTKGQLIDKKNISGSKSQLTKLVDELAKSLIASEFYDEGIEIKSLATMSSESLPALKAFLKGEQEYRKTNPFGAYQHFKEATTLDWTYAMGWLRMRDTAQWIPQIESNTLSSML